MIDMELFWMYFSLAFVFALLVVFIICELYFCRKHYVYEFEGHKIEVFVKYKTCQLVFDGKIVDEMKSVVMFSVSLNAMVDGVNVRSRIGSGFFVPNVKTFINNELVENGKITELEF